jgi:hypothetical protein
MVHVRVDQRGMTVLRVRSIVVAPDHGSTFFHPDDDHARKATQCQVTLQAEAGGDALIDASRPAMVDGFTRKTFTAIRGRSQTRPGQ